MRVSPQRRAFFRHRIFKKRSEADVFCTFWLQNVRFATAACIFSTSHLQKVLRSRRVLYIFTSKCAFRHSGVHFCDLRTSKSVPTPSVFEHFHFHMCFSPQRRAIFDVSSQHLPLHPPLYNRPTFRLTRHTNHWKNTAFRDVSNIWRGCVFFLTFVLVHLLPSDLTACLICFSTLHIVGSLLFKLPSISET